MSVTFQNLPRPSDPDSQAGTNEPFRTCPSGMVWSIRNTGVPTFGCLQWMQRRGGSSCRVSRIRLACGHVCGGIFSIANWYQRTPPILGDAIPGQRRWERRLRKSGKASWYAGFRHGLCFNSYLQVPILVSLSDRLLHESWNKASPQTGTTLAPDKYGSEPMLLQLKNLLLRDVLSGRSCPQPRRPPPSTGKIPLQDRINSR